MKNINTKQIVMSLGIVALSVLSLSAHAGNRDRDDNHSGKRSFHNNYDNHRHGRAHRSHRYGHHRYNNHRRARHNYYHSAYSHNDYGYNQRRSENHRGQYRQGHRINLLPGISGQLHLPGIRLKLHL